MTTLDAALDDRIKAAHRAMWASGDYPAVAREVISELGEVLVRALEVEPGDLVLDVAAGSGNAAVPAARAGALVTASDLAPELFDAGRLDAAKAGVSVRWREADAERLPFEDDTFDKAMSCVGIMFTPDHQRSAEELVRVVRPGGRIGLINWTPTGFIGAVFAEMKRYAPAPPPGAQPPLLWGDPDHLARLFGDRVNGLRTERLMLAVDRFAGPEEFLSFFKQAYGPTIAVYAGLESNPVAAAELDRVLIGLARENFAGRAFMQWEFLLATATVT
jgi:ubiquinone/menaquinone biosynthesis C-methylase UbiE